MKASFFQAERDWDMGQVVNSWDFMCFHFFILWCQILTPLPSGSIMAFAPLLSLPSTCSVEAG